MQNPVTTAVSIDPEDCSVALTSKESIQRPVCTLKQSSEGDTWGFIKSPDNFEVTSISAQPENDRSACGSECRSVQHSVRPQDK